MQLIEAINKGWAWIGFKASEVHLISPMGHMLLSEADNCFYYLDTDGMRLLPLGDEAAARVHFAKDDIRESWFASSLVDGAQEKLGDPPEGYVFTLSPSNWIDGQYSVENMTVLPLAEVAFLSGDLARQLKDLPDGAEIQIRVMD